MSAQALQLSLDTRVRFNPLVRRRRAGSDQKLILVLHNQSIELDEFCDALWRFGASQGEATIRELHRAVNAALGAAPESTLARLLSTTVQMAQVGLVDWA